MIHRHEFRLLELSVSVAGLFFMCFQHYFYICFKYLSYLWVYFFFLVIFNILYLQFLTEHVDSFFHMKSSQSFSYTFSLMLLR